MRNAQKTIAEFRMTDHYTIRPITVAESADAAAKRFAETREEQPNPFAGTPDEARWKANYQRYLLLHTAPADCEGGA